MSEIKKIGMYSTDEILEFMTEGEGRSFLGRSMFDAIYFEIERLNNRVKQLEKSIMISNKKHSFMTKDNIKLRTIINELEKHLEEELDRLARETSNIYEDSLGKTKLVNEDIFEELSKIKNKLQELKGVDKE